MRAFLAFWRAAPDNLGMGDSAGDTLRIGVDVGGTKIAAVALTGHGAVAGSARLATPKNDYDATVEAICSAIAEAEGQAGAQGTVGIGIPGSISPGSGTVQNSNSTWVNGKPFDRDVAARLGRPVRMANDANCFALSEAVDGAGAGARSVFGVILGTGVGGGLVYDGELVNGPRGTGGEWGHNPLPWPNPDELPGPTCWCGRQGCIETWASGPALAADHERVTGERLSAEEIEHAGLAGDADARATLDRHVSRLGRALAAAINFTDPEVVVLGGGLSAMAHLYDKLPEAIAPYLFTDTPTVTIRPPVHGSAGGVRGAAWLWGGPGGDR